MSQALELHQFERMHHTTGEFDRKRCENRMQESRERFVTGVEEPQNQSAFPTDYPLGILRVPSQGSATAQRARVATRIRPVILKAPNECIRAGIVQSLIKSFGLLKHCCRALFALRAGRFGSGLYQVMEKANCRACHNPDGVASATRLHFPDADASPAKVEAFGNSLVALVDRAHPDQIASCCAKPTNRIPHTGGSGLGPAARKKCCSPGGSITCREALRARNWQPH